MEVNRQFWDGTTTTYDEDGTERVTILTDKLWTKIQANPEKYIGKEWDKSISPWKIGNGSDLFKSMWCLPYANLENEFTFTSSPFYKERKKGYTFYLSCNGTTNSGQRPGNNANGVAMNPVWLGTLGRGDIDLTDTVTANWLNLKAGDINPVVNFDYSNIFVVPMLYNSANAGLFITSNLEANWNADDVYGLGFLFYQKKADSTSSTLTAMDIISLNNKIEKPSWTVTNSWNEDTMIDNTLALQKYLSWDGGYEISAYTAIGSHLQTGDTYIDGANYPGNGFNFDNPKLATDDAAGSVYYIANKQISIAMPTTGSDIWEDEFTPLYLGAEYNFGIHRHLKSSVTYSQFIEYVKKQLAYLGFRFCVFAEDVNKNINSEYYYIPEINEKGVTTGNYYAANSTEAQSLPNNNWTNDVYTETPYDGTDDDEEGDPNDYDDGNTTILNPIASDYENEFQNAYVLSLTAGGGAASLSDVAAFLYTEAPTNSSVDDYLSTNPIDAVVSCIMYPFRVNTQVPTAGLPFVRFGKVNANLKALGYIQSQIQIIDCGECVYYPEYGVDDFRSYEPYCDAELILPYCGSVKISPTAIYCKTTQQNFHKIKVKYIVDLSSGACLACVFLDNLLIDTVNGQIGMTVPVTGVRSSDLQRDIFHKQTGLKQAANSGLSAIASAIFGTASSGGGVSTAQALVNGALNIDSAATNYKAAEYELKHVQIPYSVRASASPLTDFANEQFPRLIIKRPVMLDYTPEIYAHSVGYACLITAEKMSDYGDATKPQYIECTGLDFSGFAGTETEKARLKNALEGGIYL